MYSENAYKNYIFWIKVKQIFILILFSIIGCLLGRLLGQFLVEFLSFEVTYLYMCVVFLTLLFFGIAMLLTSNTGKEVQEAYWKIAVLRKLTVISKKLDNLPDSGKRKMSKEIDEEE